MRDDVQRQAATSEIVVDATQQHRTAVAAAAGDQLVARLPHGAFDALVELIGGTLANCLGVELDAQEAVAKTHRLVMIDAEHMLRAHVPAGFFERLANGKRKSTLLNSSH